MYLVWGSSVRRVTRAGGVRGWARCARLMKHVSLGALTSVLSDVSFLMRLVSEGWGAELGVCLKMGCGWGASP